MTFRAYNHTVAEYVRRVRQGHLVRIEFHRSADVGLCDFRWAGALEVSSEGEIEMSNLAEAFGRWNLATGSHLFVAGCAEIRAAVTRAIADASQGR